ncbi:MAG: hypothetical protein KC438_00645 [Thermomicrobiales bacterium]|nr:hypothetical protein [Thermomicrobiales bacterium]MCO5221733.1 hypothetical protein [Thermomicrobiales bacterium]
MTSVALRIVFCLACLGALGSMSSSSLAQEAPPPSWLSAVIWGPSLPEAGAALAEHVNQIDAACDLDVDVVQATNGAGSEGAVYAFLTTWSCPASNPDPAGATWQSTIIWEPTLQGAGNALAQHLNQTDASCRVDVDDIQSTNGAGPEGPVYAFVVAWAC